MNRRRVLQNVALGGGILGLGRVTKEIYPSPDTVELWIYSSPEVRRQITIESLYSVSEFEYFLKHSVERVFNNTFETDFQVKFYQTPVELSQEYNTEDRVEAITEWSKESAIPKKSRHSNILLLSAGSTSREYSGIATLGTLPTCCSNIDRHGLVWIPKDFSPKSVLNLLSHEIGHTVGLLHSHGGILGREDGLSIMMTSDHLKASGYNFYREQLYSDASTNVTKFHKNITDEYLTL